MSELPTRPIALVALVDPIADNCKKSDRWERWRPTIGLVSHPDVIVDRVDLLHDSGSRKLARQLASDIAERAPGAVIEVHPLACEIDAPYGEANATVAAWVATQPFAPEVNPIYLHAGSEASPLAFALWSHAQRDEIPAQIVLARDGGDGAPDLRFIDPQAALEAPQSPDSAHQRPDTKDPQLTAVLGMVELVAGGSNDPLVLRGPLGSGRLPIARWVHSVRAAAGRAPGALMRVDAVVMGDRALQVLFGEGRAQGAWADARRGTLVIENIDRLSEPAQAALASRILDATTGAPGVVGLVTAEPGVRGVPFTPPLAAQMGGWRFEVPGIHLRAKDVAPLVASIAAERRRELSRDVGLEPAAVACLSASVVASSRLWPGGAHSVRASVWRLMTVCRTGVVTVDAVEAELERLRVSPERAAATGTRDVDLEALLGASQYAELDRFDRVQLEDVVRVCRDCENLSAAGRRLFAASRQRRKSVNDADRVRKYLLRYGLTFDEL